MAKKEIEGNKSIINKLRWFLDELGLFFILVVLPVISIWMSLYHIQNNLLVDAQNDTLSDMSEMTAHMIKSTEPETYYQDSLRRLSESFKWVANIDEIQRIGNKDTLELALFDDNGERLPWPANEKLLKAKFSKDYLKLLKKLSSNPGEVLTRDERNTSIGYSGNEMTAAAIADSPNTLINLQGIGLQKMGGWFKVELPFDHSKKTKRFGDLIAWLNLEKLDRYSLAEKSIKAMEKRTNSKYTFSYIDLKKIDINKSSRGKKIKKDFLNIISSKDLKSNFIYENDLFSINDTQDGLRLICSRQSPQPIPLINNYNKILIILIPILVFLFFWKKFFNINLYFSIKNQVAFIFSYASLIGFLVILISTIAYQYEKHITITQKYKNEAIEILEKVDQQYSDSFDDLIFQYKHLINELVTKPNKNPAEILAPLLKAQKENIISYAVYINEHGEKVFQAPKSSDIRKTSNLASKYSNLVDRVAIKSLKAYNSSRSDINYTNEPASTQVLTMNAVEGLLSDRSKLIEIKFNNDEPLAYLDLSINKDDFAKGCLLIIHEQSNLEMNYLRETRQNLSETKDFELIAFPKKSTNIKSYYPKYSYIQEEPLWKLNDMINQLQLPSFKKGKIKGTECIVAALPASKMKNYNLFLAMPITKLGDKVFSLSNVLLTGTALSLIFIVIISIILINSIASPINIIKKNALIIKHNQKENSQLINPDSIELESITNGLTNIVIKTKQFRESKNICSNLLPFNPFTDENYEIDCIKSQKNNKSSVFSYISKIENNLFSIFLIHCEDYDGLNTTIPLSMAGTAMKTFTEQLSIQSPSTCLTNLEEYFRFTFKTEYNWNIISIFLNTNNNKITYSVTGKINLLKIDYSSSDCKFININTKKDNTNETTRLTDCDIELSKNSSLIIIPNTLSDENIESITKEIKTDSVNKTNINKNLNNLFTKNINNNELNDFLYIYHKEENKTVNINKILAGNNPIALIRSQKIGRPTDA